MGCDVNGPVEARDADLGIADGNKRGQLFVRGQNGAVVPEAEMVDALVEWAEYINDHGVEAALERARATREAARRAAASDREDLLRAQGSDANRSEQRVELIRELS